MPRFQHLRAQNKNQPKPDDTSSPVQLGNGRGDIIVPVATLDPAKYRQPSAKRHTGPRNRAAEGAGSKGAATRVRSGAAAKKAKKSA